MQDRWKNPAETFSPQMLAVLWVTAKSEAVQWIDENAPKHWARPMFAE